MISCAAAYAGSYGPRVTGTVLIHHTACYLIIAFMRSLSPSCSKAMAGRTASLSSLLRSATARRLSLSPITTRSPMSNIYPTYTSVRPLHATSHRLNTTIPKPSAVNYPVTHDRIKFPENTRNFIDNEFVESKASKWIDLHDPATNNLVTRVPQSTEAELKAAVDSAAKAFPNWKRTSLLTRQQIMFRFVQLIRDNWDRLAASITLEQGKTFADAKGDVLRGLQVAEVGQLHVNFSRCMLLIICCSRLHAASLLK
jgi:malonate-semialdehyde dehydrogenase (acetylating)/methylmalonate-semialdehyde dehydrogenase